MYFVVLNSVACAEGQIGCSYKQTCSQHLHLTTLSQLHNLRKYLGEEEFKLLFISSSSILDYCF